MSKRDEITLIPFELKILTALANGARCCTLRGRKQGRATIVRWCARIKTKLGAQTLPEAIAVAMRKGIIQ